MGLQNSVPCWVVGRMTDKLPFGGGRHVAVKDVFDLQMGKTPSRDVPEYWNNGDHEWVSIKDLSSYGKYVGRTKETISDRGVAESRIKLVPANTLIMSFKLSLGKTAITVEPTYTNEAIMAFLDKKTYPIDLCYMYHQFSAKDWGAGTNTAVMGKTLNKKTLGATNICVPSIEVQRGVARRLDFIYSQIELTNQQLAELDSLVKSRFVEMFGNRASGEIVALQDCCSSIVGGKTPSMKHPEYYGGGIPFIKSGDVIGDRVFGGALSLSDVALEHASVKMIPAGSVLVVTRSARLRKEVHCAVCASDVAINQDIKAFTPLPEFTSDYLLWAIRSHEPDLLKTVRSVSTSGMDLGTLFGIGIRKAPLSLQQQFAAFAQQADKLRVVAEKEKQTLQTLYDSLAQEYFAI